MELKAAASPVKSSRGLSPGDDEKDLSDDDRNHKHRRRAGSGTRSQSPESASAAASAPGPPYARRNDRQPFENGRPLRDGKFQKRGRGPSGMNWRPVNPNPFGGRGLGPGVPGPPGGYVGFGPVPVGFRGPGGVVGVGRRRCRDFEEQGFCLRGDMCPMEHGVNRIVVEDVQSLSQFNLPVLLPSGQLVGTSVSSQVLPPVPSQSHSAMLMTRGTHRQNSELGIQDSNLGVNDMYSGSAAAGGTDVYDPDEPLWNNVGPEKSNALSVLRSLKNDETQPCTSFGHSDRHHTRSNNDPDNGLRNRSSAVAVGSLNTTPSEWGRICGSKDRLDVREKNILQISTSGVSEDENKEDDNALTGVRSGHSGKRIAIVGSGQKSLDSSFIQNDMTRNFPRPQKARRTIFVCGIPQISNRREALLAHFQKFGQIIDIYIPVNSETAFVQFSKREEAEAALNAPDAVMGNRFIKLWWANRDNVFDDNISCSGSVSLAPRVGAATSAQLHTPIASKAKEHFQASALKSVIIPSTNVSSLPIDHSKPVNINGPRTPPSSQKKLELEQLKEELRKKQELLEKKRNDFRHQLHKFEKQAGGSNGSEIVVEPSPKRKKTGVATDGVHAATPSPRDPDASGAFARADNFGDRSKSAANATPSNPKINPAIMQQEPASAKLPIRPTSSPRGPSSVHRYKLDNRPTSFRILPPLPSDLENVEALKEHFSSFGEPSLLELEDDESCDGDSSKEPRQCSARVSFPTRYSAEKAYVSGKHWKDSTMKFVWITSRDDPRGREPSLPASRPPSCDPQPTDNPVPSNSSEASATKDRDRGNTESVILNSIEADVISQFKPCLNGSSS